MTYSVDNNNSTLSLEYILKNPASDLFKEFANYLQQSYCIENLEFWIATQEYKKCTNDTLLASRCEKMINAYIRPNSPHEINIPCDMRQAILELYHQGIFHPHIFGDAAEAVLELMRINSFVPWMMLNRCEDKMSRMKHSSSSSSLTERWNLIKLKQISRKSWSSSSSSFDYSSDDRFTFSVSNYSNNSVYKSMLKKIKKSLSGHQRQ